jgi:hypothetical protein
MPARFVIAFLVISAATATPSAAFDLRPYVFGTAGVAEPDLGNLEDNAEAIVSTANGTGGTGPIDTDDLDAIANLGLGLQLHRYFAAELSYYHLGSYDIEANGSYLNGNGNMTARGNAQAKVRGWGLQGVIMAPITTKLSGNLSLGFAELETEVESMFEGQMANMPFLEDQVLQQFEPELGVEDANEYTGEGEYARSESITGRVQAEIIDVKPNGNLVLEARKQLRSDGESMTLVLTGTVRVEDVAADNTVLSSELYDLRLNRDSEGALRRSTEKELLTRVLETLFPF